MKRHSLAAAAGAIALVVVTACSPAAAAGGSATGAKVPRCDTITVKGKRWGVYVEQGKVACASASTVLTGVIAGKGASVDNGPANAYVRYSGWVCPYDQMGVVDCQTGSRPVADAGRQIFALSCATGVGEPACPLRGEP
jgi:hypothetical protein